MPFSARYYDGKTGAPHDAKVELLSTALSIQLATLPALHWDYPQVKIAERPEQGRPLVVTNITTPAAQLVINDAALYDDLRKRIPRGNAPRISVSLSGRSMLLWSVAAVAVVTSVYWVTPQLAAPLARHFPPAWERQLGDYGVDALAGSKPACNNPEGEKALDKLVDTLTAAAENHSRVRAQVVQDKAINAFTVPNGRIIIFSHLIDVAATPDELAGVIAHEMGHVIKRHSLQSLIRVLGLDLVVKMAFGDATKTAAIANDLFQLRYSRRFEREADQQATEILYSAGIDDQGFIRFFDHLRNEHKGADDTVLSYASTHPPTAERIAAIKQAPHVAVSRQVLTGDEWQAIKNICK